VKRVLIGGAADIISSSVDSKNMGKSDAESAECVREVDIPESSRLNPSFSPNKKSELREIIRLLE
jgi:hypothetical protein